MSYKDSAKEFIIELSEKCNEKAKQYAIIRSFDAQEATELLRFAAEQLRDILVE